jgi:hypothetical protein
VLIVPADVNRAAAMDDRQALRLVEDVAGHNPLAARCGLADGPASETLPPRNVLQPEEGGAFRDRQLRRDQLDPLDNRRRQGVLILYELCLRVQAFRDPPAGVRAEQGHVFRESLSTRGHVAEWQRRRLGKAFENTSTTRAPAWTDSACNAQSIAGDVVE